MRAQIRLGRLFGVDVGLHYSWFLIALLITLSLAGHFRVTHPEWEGGAVWATALMTGALFFVALLAHELSHALVAKANGLPVRSITLFALGGVAHIEKEAGSPKAEFWMGIVGPITSAGIGVLCLAAAWALGWEPAVTPPTPLLTMLVWLGYINFVLALFNMVPGFPLDGGRVLRAVIWWVTGDANRSTRIAAAVGQLVALGLIAFGVLRFFGGGGFGGLWLAFIGWFLLDAARASAAQVEVMTGLQGVRVGDVMSRECLTVDGRVDLQTFAEEYLLRTGRRCFLIAEDGRVIGLITPHEVKEVARDRWPQTAVRDAMRPLRQLRTVRPATPLAEALEMMGREDVNQLPVMSDGRLEGIISRANIFQLLRARAELHM